ncbi:hypothetical protein BDY17DRAFT_320489 [Neohortaea acidophila]|uniref:Uncharacterized protein n=1 Tax=Neohortaea acidophila TaxID=245834 RepID=A0A6A6Q6H0_9PEZI|nr:uncharacterized protein BDY17DRAFT_320489 [Neohortaea acidophila]KAF2487980.1 hypothetical protein BDY17DRAFT_320489 [Neohortaea acidophila]
MERDVTAADVTLNRYNVALARSKKVLESWLPNESGTVPPYDSEGEEDFTAEPEDAGIGSEVTFHAGDLPGSTRLRKSNHQLLEQLLGKKAAEAHQKKTQDSGKSFSAGKHVAAKPLVSRQKASQGVSRRGDDDDEEGGRSAAFQSRKPAPPKPAQVSDSREHHTTEAEDQDGMSYDEDSKQRTKRSPDRPTPTKRKNTYLDELLAQKAKKSKKNRSREQSTA